MALPAGQALRGLKTLIRAFYEAADAIPLDRRPAVVKAALSSIRDELKIAREKAKLAKTKVASAPARKAAPSTAKTALSAAKRSTPAKSRVATRASRKALVVKTTSPKTARKKA